MKKRGLLLTAFAVAFAVSASALTAFGGFKNFNTNVKADTSDNAYWSQYFDVSSDGDVNFDSTAVLPEYLVSTSNGVYEVDKETGLKVDSYYRSYATGLEQRYKTGLGVTFTHDTTLTYKVPVLTESLTKNLTLFDYLVAPNQKSEKKPETLTDSTDVEFSNVTIRLENYENPNEFIEIEQRRYGYYIGQTYLRVKSHTAGLAGLVKGAINGDGRNVDVSFNGVTQGVQREPYILIETPRSSTIRFDSSTNTAYASYTVDKTNEYENGFGVIRSLSNPSHMLAGDKVFEQFSCKYLRLSIKFSELTAEGEESHIYLSNMLGNTLTEETFNDKVAPIIALPEICKNDNTPVGEVGAYYPFWDVIGYDFNEGVITNKLTYLVKNDATGETIENDGSGFTPNKQGTYSVTINLTDSAGNNAKTVTTYVKVVPIIDDVTITFDSASLPYPTNVLVGQKVKVPNYEVSGGTGTLNVDFKITYNDTEEVEIENGSFTITKAGIYKASYLATDYIGKKCERVFAITAELSPSPIYEDVVAPTIYKKGSSIILNMPKAYDYYTFAGYKQEVPVTMYAVSYKAGETVVDSDYEEVYANVYGDYEFTPDEEDDFIKVRCEAYSLTGTNLNKLYLDEITLFNTPELADYWNYNSDEITREVEESGDEGHYYYQVTKAGAELNYLIPTQSSSFGICLDFYESYSNFKKISIVLRDSKNYNQVVTFTITSKDSSNLYITTNGGDVAQVYGQISKVTEGVSNVALRFKGVNKIYDYRNTELLNLTKFDDGTAFNGFSSGKVYAKVVFDEFVNDEDAYNSVKISEFYTQTNYLAYDSEGEEESDETGPTIVLDGAIPSYAGCLQTVQIPSAKAYDLYSPYCTVSVFVKDPNNKTIYSSTQGKATTIQLTQYGQYTVTYTSRDDEGNPRSLNRKINIMDDIAPVIEINGQIKTTAKVGDVLTLPTYNVTDNKTEDSKLLKYVYLSTPTFGYKTISVGDDMGTYIFQVEGDYTLVYFAMDDSSNYTYKTFTIHVTK